MKEQWKDIPEWEGNYQASDLGRIRSLDRVVQGRWGKQLVKGQLLLPNSRSTSCRYLAVALHVNGIQTTISVHKLVALTWIGPCPKGQQIRHGRLGFLENSVSNLLYGTPLEQEGDKRRDGTSLARPVKRSDGVEFSSLEEGAEETGCSGNGIGNACQGRAKTAGGYGWKYIN